MKKSFSLILTTILFVSISSFSSCKKEAEKANVKFAGTYNGTLSENGTLLGAETYNVVASSSNESGITVYPLLLDGTVSGNAITFARQRGNSTTTYTYGNGNLSGNSLTLNLTTDDGTTTSTVVFSGSK